MCCVGGVVSYARGNAWGLGFEFRGTQRWEALFFLKLGGPLVPIPDPGLKDPPFSPGCLLPGGEPGLERVPHRE